MRIRRSLGLAIAAATLAGLSLTGAATARAGTPITSVTPDQCREGGGTVDSKPYAGEYCSGGTYGNSPIA
ncbi:hypothetical protein [Streptomyces sp. NPDC096934]|uniref:hypothetical protein n=1 Tax=unclassified Streptomyces TaxID=2593676 RepID=UPI00331A4E59